MGDKHINIIGNISIVLDLTLGDAVAYEHRDAIESDAVYLNVGVAEIMHIFIQSVDIGAIETIVMVATNEYFMPVWQIAEPIEKIKSLFFGAYHAEVARMHNNISRRQIPKLMMASMSIGEMKDLHLMP